LGTGYMENIYDTYRILYWKELGGDTLWR